MIKISKINVLIYFFFTVISLYIFFIPIGNLDELWNYNFARCISNGLEPYVDFNMLQTPLSAYISGLFLKLFGAELFVFRVLSYILMVTILIAFYNLSQQIVKSRALALILSAFVFSLLSFVFFYDYNYLILLVVLLILNIVVKYDTSATVQQHILSAIFGILPLIKQSTGFILLLAYISYIIYDAVKSENIKNGVINFMIVALPIVIYTIYLIASGRLSFFVEYTVKGVADFTHKYTFIDFSTSNIIAFLMSIIIVSVIAAITYFIIKNKMYTDKKTKCFIIAVLFLILTTYPLFDLQHFIIGVIPLISIAFIFYPNINIKRFEKNILVVVSVLLIALSIYQAAPKNDVVISEQTNYNNLLISQTTENSINEVKEYIEEYQKGIGDIYIADATAVAYMIPANRYSKNLDMLLKGNIGNITTDELLDVDNDTAFLILKDEEKLNKQSCYDVIEQIKRDFVKIDEVACFDVYKKEG